MRSKVSAAVLALGTGWDPGSRRGRRQRQQAEGGEAWECAGTFRLEKRVTERKQAKRQGWALKQGM